MRTHHGWWHNFTKCKGKAKKTRNEKMRTNVGNAVWRHGNPSCTKRTLLTWSHRLRATWHAMQVKVNPISGTYVNKWFIYSLLFPSFTPSANSFLPSTSFSSCSPSFPPFALLPMFGLYIYTTTPTSDTQITSILYIYYGIIMWVCVYVCVCAFVRKGLV